MIITIIIKIDVSATVNTALVQFVVLLNHLLFYMYLSSLLILRTDYRHLKIEVENTLFLI